MNQFAKKNICLVFVFITALACQATTAISPALSLGEAETGMTAANEITLNNLSLMNGSEITLYPAQNKQLYLKAELSNGKNYRGIKRQFSSIYHDQDSTVVWYSNDPLICGVSASGIITGRLTGTTTLLATLLNKTAAITVQVIDKPETSNNTTADIASTLENENADENILPEESTPEVTDTDTLEELNITTASQSWETGESTTLYASLHFAEAGILNNVSYFFYLGDNLEHIDWTSSDVSIAAINQGRITFTGYGTVMITASYGGHQDEIVMTVKNASEPPLDSSDYFLNEGDVLSDFFGPNSGFGYSSFPEIIYDAPGGTYDVVSFGDGGELLVELSDYLITDGLGNDFTIFENPFTGWEECAQVAVSEDGITYQEFSCDQFDDDGDGVFTGCAGKTPVVYGLADSGYLDTSQSGGDAFDLDELDTPLATVKYIRITDIGLCGATTPVPSGTSAGFDMDALAIVNGVNTL